MYRIGIDLGGTNIVTGLVNEAMEISDRVSVKTALPRSAESMIEDMGKMVEELLERNGLSRADIEAVGIGVPGTTNGATGRVEYANNLGFVDVPIVEMLENRVHIPVFFDNDANVAAWGEYMTGNYEEDSFIMVTLGTGVGGGIVLDGKLWTGINFAGAELGHTTINYAGIPCNCGRIGCFEAYGSATALIEQAQQKMISDPDTILWKLCDNDPSKVEAKTVFDGVKAQDEACLELLDTYTTYLAEGIANIINIFQPAYLSIGGGVSKAGETLLEPLRKKVARRIYSRYSKRNTEIILAKLDNDAGVIGAALLGKM